MSKKTKPQTAEAVLDTAALRVALSQAVAERAQLAAELPTLAGRALLGRNGADELATSKARLSELNETISGLEHAIKESERADVAAQRAEAHTQKAQADSKIAELVADAERIKGEIAELNARLSAAANEAEALKAQKPALAAAGLVGGDAEARAELDSINTQLAALDDVRLGLEHNIGRKRAELETAKARVEAARKEAAGHTYEVARVRLAEARELFAKRISEAGEALDQLASELGVANTAAALIGTYVEPWHATRAECAALIAKTLGRHRGPNYIDLGAAELTWIQLQAAQARQPK